MQFETEMGMTVETSPPIEGMQSMLPDNSQETLTTLWLAPNVGIVKMAKEPEDNNRIKTFESTDYEIISTESESEATN